MDAPRAAGSTASAKSRSAEPLRSEGQAEHPAPAPASAPSGRMIELDSLRGLAALVVVAHHVLLVLPDFSRFVDSGSKTSPNNLFEAALFNLPLRLLWNGHSAVLLFFVLSGFVLATPWVRRKPTRYHEYAIRRIFRIYVPYLAVVSAVMVVVYFSRSTPIATLSRWFNSSWLDPVSASTVVDHVLMLGNQNVIDNPIWSLIWEMRVSLIFPFIVLPMMTWGAKGIWASIASVAVAYGVLHALRVDDQLAFPPSETLFYGIAFAMGAGIAFGRQTLWPWLSKHRLGVPLLLLGLIAVGQPWPLKRQAADFIPMVGSLAIITGCVVVPGVRRALLHAVPVWMGRISYSLYLVHVPVILFLVHTLYGVIPIEIILLLAVGTSILVAAVVNATIERPSENFGRWLGARV
jgi:peptidoglycan/LPS O-acetylase OafA/YrhL